MKFTKEEISLCKQIAEKQRFEKLIEEGDWIQQNYGTPCIDLVTSEYIRNILRFTDVKHWFPLWTISDCLEFLREKASEIELWQSERKPLWFFRLRDYKKAKRWWKGKTPLEALLKAVLAVLGEE